MIREYDTIASIATPVSNSGIGIIRISGSDSLNIIASMFRPYNQTIDEYHLSNYRIYYGNIVEDKGSEKENVIDECIILVMKSPHSYTKEDVVEIDCHGGIFILKKILELVIKSGARLAEPGEFTKRAFLNGRIDLSQAEAVMDLIDSKSELARKNSMSQLKGNLSEKIIEIRKDILYNIAVIESALDDPEHYDLTGFSDVLYKKTEEWIHSLSDMVDSYDSGRMISEGIRTCIVGKPNAGKSSFLNALLGEERAIVTEIAGTTRDTLEESITIGEINLRIIDTAGIRDTKDLVESIGVERAKKEMDEADLILFLMDRSVVLSDEDYIIMDQIRDKKKMILLNKSDIDEKDHLLSEKDIYNMFDPDTPIIPVSAKYSEGIDIFRDELKRIVFHGDVDMNKDTFISNARHKAILENGLECLCCVRESIESKLPEDFFTIDLMEAYEVLGRIIGEAVEDDLINEIFSRFCTGK